jgi:hypothetical protein
MSRLSYVGVLLSVALLVQSLVAQDRAITKHAIVQHVLVRDRGQDIEVEIQTSGAPVSPDTQAISGPDRIIVDFPGTLPSSSLRALKVDRGALKDIRSGLFFSNPPITRIVLDLSAPQSYQISTIENAIVVKLGPTPAAGKQATSANHIASPRLRDASLASGQNVPVPHLSTASASVGTVTRASISQANLSNASLQSSGIATAMAPPQAPKPMNVTYENGMLRIRAEKVTLAQILFEVHRSTQAEIAIPAGAEQEEVIADLGPAPARDVLGALLNGSSYNFIFVGNELSLERVILTRRDSTHF